MKCHVVRDLLPLYQDDLVSEETRESIKEHLKECPECSGVYVDTTVDLESMVSTVVDFDVQQPLVNSLKSLKKRLHYKTLVTIIVSIVSAVVIVSTTSYWVFFAETPVPYAEVQRTLAEQINSPSDFVLLLDGHNTVQLLYVDDSLYVCCLDTVWTRYFARPNSPQDFYFVNFADYELPVPEEPLERSEPIDLPSGLQAPDDDLLQDFEPLAPFDPPGPIDPFTFLDNVNKVYYIEADMRGIDYGDLAFYRAIENAQLIWQR